MIRHHECRRCVSSRFPLLPATMRPSNVVEIRTLSNRCKRDGAVTAEQRYIRRLIITLALVGVAALAWHLRALLLLAFGAGVLAVVLRSVAKPIEKYCKAPSWLSLTLAITLIVSVTGALSWFFGGEISSEIGALLKELPDAWRSFETRVRSVPIGDQALESLSAASEDGTSLIRRATGFVTSLGGGLADVLVLVVLVLAVYAQGE